MAGLLLGLLANVWQRQTGEVPALVAAATSVAEVIGQLFLRLMLVVVLPLVVSSLALAVVEVGDLRKLGRAGVRTLVFSGLLSDTVVLLGLGLVNPINPGTALAERSRDALLQREARDTEGVLQKAAAAKPLKEVLVDVVPQNPLQEIVGAIDGSSKRNGMMAVMILSLLVGAAIATHPERYAGPWRGSKAGMGWR